MAKSNNKTLLGVALVGIAAFFMVNKSSGDSGNGSGGAELDPLAEDKALIRASNPMVKGSSNPVVWQSWLQDAIDVYGGISQLFAPGGPFEGYSETTVFYSVPHPVRASFGWTSPYQNI